MTECTEALAALASKAAEWRSAKTLAQATTATAADKAKFALVVQELVDLQQRVRRLVYECGTTEQKRRFVVLESFWDQGVI